MLRRATFVRVIDRGVGVALRVLKDTDQRVFRLAGELDMATADQLIQKVRGTAKPNGDICLDLEGLEFIDSSGIHAVVALCREVREGARVILRSPKGEVAKALDLVRADRFPNLVIDWQRGLPTESTQAS